MSRRLITLLCSTALFAQSTAVSAGIWINEFHYDNSGTDQFEFVEVAGNAGSSLAGWKIELYNGSNNSLYDTINLSGSLGDQLGGYGTKAFFRPGIQNGDPDGFALIDSSNNVVQFLSYGGAMSINRGGQSYASVNIGKQAVAAVDNGRVRSMQLTGKGTQYSDFTWSQPASLDTRDAVNAGQSFGPKEPEEPAQRLAIYAIQGAGHKSAHEGKKVVTEGVVTQIRSNGYYIQDVDGDGNAATSDAIFIFTGSGEKPALNTKVKLSGTVSEFQPDANNLTVTQLTNTTIIEQAIADRLPQATVIGASGRTPPKSIIDDDNFGSFDPAQDGIDFYESLEGMVVKVAGAKVVGPNPGQGAKGMHVISDADTSGRNGRGGITTTAGDFNPERLRVATAPGGPVGSLPDVNVGADLGDITGVLNYYDGGYEVLPSGAVNASNTAPPVETTTIKFDQNRLRVASYNIENFDNARATASEPLVHQIIDRLGAPEIIGLQEVLGATNGGSGGSAATALQTLVDKLNAKCAGSCEYAFVQRNPDYSNGGNQRNAFLYRTDRVELKDAVLVDPNGEFKATNSRSVMQGTFEFNGHLVTILNNHWTARTQESPLFGDQQPPSDPRGQNRLRQGAALALAIADALKTTQNVITLGDFNEFYFGAPFDAIRAAGLVNLAEELLAAADRYSYVFEGNSQLIDHIWATAALRMLNPLFDIVHFNAEYFAGFLYGDGSGGMKWSDHDAQLASFYFAPVPAPSAILLMALGLVGVGFARRRRRFGIA